MLNCIKNLVSAVCYYFRFLYHYLRRNDGKDGATAENATDHTQLKSIMQLPGPMGYPVIGTLLDYFKSENIGKVHELHQKRHEQYGKFMKERLGMSVNVNLADPKLVLQLLKQEGRNPCRPPYQAWSEYNKLRGYDPGLFMAQGKRWEHYRKIVSKCMIPQNCLKKSLESFQDVTSTFINRLRQKSATHAFIPDLCNELYLFCLECTVSALLNNRLGCLEPVISQRAKVFIEGIGDIFKTGFQMIVGANIHRWLNTKCWRRHRDAWDNVLHITRCMIQDKMDEMENIENTNDPEAVNRMNDIGILVHLLNDGKLSLDEVCRNMAEIMTAGIDTASNSLAFTIYLLATHPKIQDKLYDDIKNVTNGNPCNFDDLNQLPYLKYILKESLRLYPVVPVNARVVQNDTNLGGYLIPEGTCVLLNIYTMTRCSELYEKPDTFNPDRWELQPTDERKCPSSTEFSPFGFGGRMCVGRKYAEVEMGLAICSIVQNFRLVPHDSLQLNVSVRTVMTPGDKLNIIFEKRLE